MSEHIGDHIKAVLFDHDNTLVGTITAKWAQHRHIAKQYYNRDLTDDELRANWGKPLTSLAGLLYGTDDTATAMEHLKASHEEFPKSLHNDTIATLEQLHKAGKRIGIITATSRYSFEYDLSNLGIPAEILDYTQTEEDTAYHKPDSRVFDPAITWLGTLSIQPVETLYVGDGLHDMKAALGAGFEFIGVSTGLVTQDEFSIQGAQAITKLGDLLT